MFITKHEIACKMLEIRRFSDLRFPWISYEIFIRVALDTFCWMNGRNSIDLRGMLPHKLHNVSILSKHSEHLYFDIYHLSFVRFFSLVLFAIEKLRSCSLTHSSHSCSFFLFHLCSLPFQNWHSIRWYSWDSFENSNQ